MVTRCRECGKKFPNITYSCTSMDYYDWEIEGLERNYICDDCSKTDPTDRG